MLLLLTSLMAAAGDRGSADAMSLELRQAEYVRIGEELQQLATRNAWSGVERSFGELEALVACPADLEGEALKDCEEDPSRQHRLEVLVAAAHSARARGDIREVERRLKLGSRIREDQDLLTWLWSLKEQYGPVMVAADADKTCALTVVQMPFDPGLRKVVEFIQEAVATDCAYEGLIPYGDYVFVYGREEVPLTVKRGGSQMRVDARKHLGRDKKSAREKRKKKRR